MTKCHLFQDTILFLKIGQKKYTTFFFIKQNYTPENSVWLCKRYHKNRRQSADIKNLHKLSKKKSRHGKNYRVTKKMVTYCLVTRLHTLNLYFASNLQTEKSRTTYKTNPRLETDKFYQYCFKNRACLKCLCLSLCNTKDYNETSFNIWGMNSFKNHLTIFTFQQHMKSGDQPATRLHLEHLLYLPQCFCIKQILL